MATTNDDMTVLNFARKVQAIAQNGLTFTQNPYDRQRFQQLQEIAASLVAAELAIPLGQAKSFWKGDDGYATPKVDVRGAIFDGDKVLLVRERCDGVAQASGEIVTMTAFRGHLVAEVPV